MMIPNDIHDMVLRFDTVSERERNKIFILIRSIYIPKYFKKRLQYKKQWWDFLDSELDYQVLQCIRRWNPDKGVLFTTYLYRYVVLKPFSAVTETYIFKSRREPNWTTLGLNNDDDE